MSSHPIHVFSEIGKLKKVMLHRPGRELENLLPDYLEMLKENMMHLPKLFVMKESKFST